MLFTHAPLRAAARACLEHGTGWSQLDAAALVAALRSVPGIGPKTAGVAVADFSGDFSVYPYPDRAIQTSLRRAAPATDWVIGDAEFRTRWRAICVGDVSGLTQLVLAWGQAHARAAQLSAVDRPADGRSSGAG